MEQLIFGKPVADNLDAESKKIFTNFTLNKRKPKISAITVGENPASMLYVSRKQEKADELGVIFDWNKYPASITQKQLETHINEISNNTDGLIVQLPLPDHLNPAEVINCIPPEVDVDGLTSVNLGKLFSFNYQIIPATSLAVLEMLKFYSIETVDKNVVIAGRSRLVSAPLAKILSSKKFNANVTVIHSYTSNQKLFIQNADIFISAVGSAKIFDQAYFKKGSTVIDIGISTVDGKTYGDVDPTGLVDYLSFRAPYPGGVGPVTVSALFYNLAKLIN